MSLWRREAIERFPEMRREIARAEGAYFVWLALWQAVFLPAYEQEPPDCETTMRLYEYAAWSLKQPDASVRMAAEDGFYQRLADDPRTRQDMPRWISPEEFDSLRYAWDYMTPQNYAALRREFMKNKARIEKEKKAERHKPKGG